MQRRPWPREQRKSLCLMHPKALPKDTRARGTGSKIPPNAKIGHQPTKELRGRKRGPTLQGFPQLSRGKGSKATENAKQKMIKLGQGEKNREPPKENQAIKEDVKGENAYAGTQLLKRT